MDNSKLIFVQKALAVAHSTFYWMNPNKKLIEIYVNKDNSGTFTPSEDGLYTTGNHGFIQIECEDIILCKYGSYDERRVEDGRSRRVGDGTVASLQLQEDKIVLIQTKEDAGEALPPRLLCSLDQIVGLSILKKYGEAHKNYKF